MIDLSRYQVRVEEILARKRQIESSVKTRELNWLFLKAGESAMIRVIPIPGGLISKEVHRYRFGDVTFVSPFYQTGVEDPFMKMQKFLFERADYWEKMAAAHLNENHPSFKTVASMLTSVREEAKKLSDRTEHYILCLHYPLYGKMGVDFQTDLSTVEGPKIMRMSEQTFLKLLGIMSSPMYSNPPVTDFEAGRRIFISRQGSGLDTKYDVIAEPQQTPFPRDNAGNLRSDLLEACPDLDRVFAPDEEKAMNEFLYSQGYYSLLETFESKMMEIFGGRSPQPSPFQVSQPSAPVSAPQPAFNQPAFPHPQPPPTIQPPQPPQFSGGPEVPPTLVKPQPFVPSNVNIAAAPSTEGSLPFGVQPPQPPQPPQHPQPIPQVQPPQVQEPVQQTVVPQQSQTPVSPVSKDKETGGAPKSMNPQDFLKELTAKLAAAQKKN